MFYSVLKFISNSSLFMLLQFLYSNSTSGINKLQEKKIIVDFQNNIKGILGVS